MVAQRYAPREPEHALSGRRWTDASRGIDYLTSRVAAHLTLAAAIGRIDQCIASFGVLSSVLITPVPSASCSHSGSPRVIVALSPARRSGELEM